MSSFSDLPSLLPFFLNHFSWRQLQKVEQTFASLPQALQASVSDWKATNIASEKQLAGLFDSNLEYQIEESLQWHSQSNQKIVSIGSDDYPTQLKEISDPPIALFVRGEVELLSDPQIAIVGSRHASKQGINTAKDFGEYLSSQGLGVTSGLALGIDGAAHEGALSGVGKTVAVVATGLDRVYPSRHRELAHRIVENGVMVSEFPLGSKPLAYHFPKRNRIISGLSLGTLVVEAALKSGSLITAKTALEQGREVFAVPGSIHNPQAKGCHQLIKQGAKLVESGQDILEEISHLISVSELEEKVSTQLSTGLNEISQTVNSDLLQVLQYEPMGLDELVVLTKRPVSTLQSELLMLELSGEIEALSAGRWLRIR